MSQALTEPHSTKPIEDAVGWGLETDAETLIALSTDNHLREPRDARALRARAVPRARDPRRRGPDQPASTRRGARRGDGRVARDDGGRGHFPHARDPVKVNLLVRDFVKPAPPAAPLGARQVAPQARPLRLLPDRPRPRPAGRRDRRRAAEAPPRPRDRLARAASRHRRPRGAWRADPPGQRVPRQRVHAHRERVGRARPPLLPGDPPDGRDPARELHGLPRPRPRGAVRPLDRGRGVGARLLPPRESRAEAHAATSG